MLLVPWLAIIPVGGDSLRKPVAAELASLFPVAEVALIVYEYNVPGTAVVSLNVVVTPLEEPILTGALSRYTS